MVDAIEQGNRPKPGREPRVEGCFILTEVGRCEVGIARLFLGQAEGFFGRFGHHKFFHFGVGSAEVVGRNAVSPPKLSADAPILDVAEPVVVGVLVFGRVEFEFVVHHGRERDVGKVLHREIPLHAEARLNGGVGISFRVAHLVVVVFNFFEQTGGFEVDGNLFAHFHAVLSHIHTSRL